MTTPSIKEFPNGTTKKALVHERLYPFQGVDGQIILRVADRLYGIEGASPRENGEPGKERLLVLFEQRVAPRHRGPQGPLPLGQVASSPVRSFKRSPSLSSIFWGVRTFTRAAASSMARGNPSRLAQISDTVGAFSLDNEKSGLASLALSIKSLTASYWVRRSKEGNRSGSGKEREGTGYSRSP